MAEAIIKTVIVKPLYFINFSQKKYSGERFWKSMQVSPLAV